MTSRSPAPALRKRLLLVLLGATLPLGLLGLWIVRGAQENARALLRSRLDAELAQTEAEVAMTWRGLKSNLLTLGENESVRLLLVDSAETPAIPAFVSTAFAQMTAIDRVVIRDRADRERLRLEAPGLADSGRRGESTASAFGVPVRLPLTDLSTGDTVGSLQAIVRLTSLVPSVTRPASRDGPLIAVATAGAGTLYPGTVDSALFNDESVEWERERWTTVRRTLREPQITLALAGALSPFEGPFALAARRSTLALLLAFVTIVLVSGRFLRRIARDVEQELAQREALATVGEFASELAHEVRNPLTAMRLDLQRAEESVEHPEVLRVVLPRVLTQITRLDRAVSGALRVSRSGIVDVAPLDLRAVLQSARLSADPEFTRRSAAVAMLLPDRALTVQGDPDALEQLFLNLLLNAAQALPPGGMATVSAVTDAGSVVVDIRDDGVGMTADQLQALQSVGHASSVSSRRDGNGLGLKVARRIAETHQGELLMDSRPGEGTSVRVRLPSSRRGWPKRMR